MVVKHGRSTTPNVKVVARHFERLCAEANAVCGDLIRAHNVLIGCICGYARCVPRGLVRTDTIHRGRPARNLKSLKLTELNAGWAHKRNLVRCCTVGERTGVFPSIVRAARTPLVNAQSNG